jgi:urea carboxylase-associated protein 2
MPTLPASTWSGDLPPDVTAADLTWAETVAGGGYTSKLLSRGTTIRLTDLHGDSCAHVLLFNGDQPWERLNVADTVKVPWQAYLTAGHPLLSDQGRILATIARDTSSSHDAIAGTSSLAANVERYGDGSPQSATPSGRELFKLAAAKHNLEPRDLPPSVSFFKGVGVGDDGELNFSGGSGAGSFVELHCEMPVTVLIANVPHPLDPRDTYTCTTLEVLAWPGAPTSPSDPLWSATPEIERAFLNTADYLEAGAR